jgi:hypothetical protein
LAAALLPLLHLAALALAIGLAGLTLLAALLPLLRLRALAALALLPGLTGRLALLARRTALAPLLDLAALTLAALVLHLAAAAWRAGRVTAGRCLGGDHTSSQRRHGDADQ